MQRTISYVDGMGESGLQKLHDIRNKINRGRPDSARFGIYRVPLAASEDSQRNFCGYHPGPITWDEIREEYGFGRYEVVLLGPPPQKRVFGWKLVAQRLAYAALPWLDNSDDLVALGRASAAMFDTIDFGMMKPPVPKPVATQEQPSLFNPEDVAIPAYVKDSDTSFLAAEAVAPYVNELQEKVLGVVLDSGTKGMTCDEVEVALDMPHQTASARINELMAPTEERPQMLFDSGARRKTRHNQLATVWIHRTILFG